MNIIIPRGCSKPGIQYICGLKKLYEDGKISKEHYITMKYAAYVMLFDMPEEQALKLMEKELKEVDDKDE